MNERPLARQVAALPPPADSIHIWYASTAEDYNAYFAVLSASEQARAGRYRLQPDRQSYVVTRGRLRCLLSAYTDKRPSQIKITLDQYGKPHLDPDQQPDPEQPLTFNISHTREVSVFAFSRGRPLGIDAETIDESVNVNSLASQFFAPREKESLQELPAAQRPNAFFRIWTRKEALVKAAGMGLRIPLDSFAVSATPDFPRLIYSNHSALDGRRWHLYNVQLPHMRTICTAAAGGKRYPPAVGPLPWPLDAPPPLEW